MVDRRPAGGSEKAVVYFLRRLFLLYHEVQRNGIIAHQAAAGGTGTGAGQNRRAARPLREEGGRQVREKRKPAKKEQAKPPERESVLKRLRQLQAEVVFCKRDFHILSIDDCFLFALRTVEREVS